MHRFRHRLIQYVDQMLRRSRSRRRPIARSAAEILEQRQLLTCLAPTGTSEAYSVEHLEFTDSGGTQFSDYNLTYRGFHFATFRLEKEAGGCHGEITLRPHPDQEDVDAWGGTYHVKAYVHDSSGQASVTGVHITDTGIQLAATGDVPVLSDGSVTSNGTWSWSMTMTYLEGEQIVVGTTGVLAVSLNEPIENAIGQELKLFKNSNHLVSPYPLQTGGSGTTGDQEQLVSVTKADGTVLIWDPLTAPSHFPPEGHSTGLSIHSEGTSNVEDPWRFGADHQIKIARKPTINLSINAVSPQHTMFFGGVWTTAHSQLFSADNIATHALVGASATQETMLEYALEFRAEVPDAPFLKSFEAELATATAGQPASDNFAWELTQTGSLSDELTDLPAGEYKVTVIAKGEAGAEFDVSVNGQLAAVALQPGSDDFEALVIEGVNLRSGTNEFTVDFLKRDAAQAIVVDKLLVEKITQQTEFGTVSGLVRTTEQAGIENAHVFVDTNNNGLPDPGELQTRTAADGSYALADVPVGSHLVRVADLNLHYQTSPDVNQDGGAFAVDVAAEQLVSGVSFEFAELAVIAGQTFHDVNADGYRATQEIVEFGLSIDLQGTYHNVYGQEEHWLRDADGRPVAFLPGGDLILWDRTPRQVTGTTIGSVDPGIHDNPEILTSQQAEIGRNGVTVHLLNADGEIVDTMITASVDLNGDGQIDTESEVGVYEFQVTPGSYSVSIPAVGRQRTGAGITNTAAAQAYALDQNLQLVGGNLFENWGGLGEKWVHSETGWHYITPDGTLYRWNTETRPGSLSGTAVTQFPVNFYRHVDTLFDAKNPLISAQPGTPVRLESGIYDTAIVRVEHFDDLNQNGVRQSHEPGVSQTTAKVVSLRDGVTVPVADGITAEDGTVEFEVDPGVSVAVQVTLPEDRISTSPDGPDPVLAFLTQQKFQLRTTGSLFRDWGGRDELWLFGQGGWYFLTPDGRLSQWDGLSGRGAVEGVVVEDGLGSFYHDHPEELYEASNPEVDLFSGDVSDWLFSSVRP